ncbi:MAG: riboflavin synthase [Burkholderiaceae bacterium]|nr:MAG: riboflavin synthase [Burkholderiaceae bacterium]
MFTGIVAAMGTIETVTPIAQGVPGVPGVRLRVHAGALALDDVALGDSIAINGACMTVVEKSAPHFAVDVSQESLRCTAGLNQPGPVNLEKALRLSDRLGGHLVSGHVDGVGTVTCLEAVGVSMLLKILTPLALAKYFAHKGSVVVDGVSLTINQVEDLPAGCEIAINLIPHTLQMTTLQYLHVGSKVNLEVDLMARYCERMLSLRSQ